MNIDFESLQLFNENDCENIKLTVAGDWAPISGNTSQILINEGKDYYSDIAETFKDSDINIVNLETVIGEDNKKNNKYGRKFIDSNKVLQSLTHADTNLVCLANNHIMDNDKEGLISTQEALTSFGINYIGAGLNHNEIYKPFLLEKDGSNVAIINIADGELCNEKYNSSVGSADMESYKVIDMIRQYKEQNYVVIIIIHAGIEFLPTPAPFIQTLYRNFIDEGADIIIGHHPHVIQGIEIYKNKPILYSIGHFSIYRKDSRNQEKIGIIPQIYIGKDGVSKIKITPFEITKNKLLLIKGEKLQVFINKFRYLSELIENKKAIDDIWMCYIEKRNIILDFKKAVEMYKYNFRDSKYIMKNMASTTNFRYLLSSYCDGNNKVENEYNDLLKEYRLDRNIKFIHHLFLIQKNIFSSFHEIKKQFWNNLRSIKRLLIK